MENTSVEKHNNNNSETVKNDKSEKNKKLKELTEKISQLENFQYIEILKILEKNNIKFTQNNNGIFINMNKLDENIIDEFENYLKYINNIDL